MKNKSKKARNHDKIDFTQARLKMFNFHTCLKCNMTYASAFIK